MLNMNVPEVLSMDPAAASDGAAAMTRFADKYRKEPDLRARIEENPIAVFTGYGIELPPGTDIRVVEDTAEVFHFTMPFAPNADLTDEQLDRVAGGTGYRGPDLGDLPALPDRSSWAVRQVLPNGMNFGCFLTTAVVERRGEADDGPTLSALRGFRDGYMMETAERRALVADYYRTAPSVVAAIPEDHADWGWIGERVDDAVAAVGNGDDDAAFAIYVDLMERLTGRWLGSAEGGR